MTAHRIITAALAAALLLSACSDGSDSGFIQLPEYDFSAADEAMQQFIDDSTTFDGISYTLVDVAQGAVHEAAFGDHTLDIVVYLASTSKMPSVTLLMALHDDESLNFDVTAPIENYLPWTGVYGDRTTEQLVSNTSGIPGLSGLDDYVPAGHMCQFYSNFVLQECAETLYSNEVAGTVPAGTAFDYGGSQWQLSGGVAEIVSNSTWNQALDAYIAQPCDLEVFTYGNMWVALAVNPDAFDGDPDSLFGQQNAHVEGGAITNMQDYAKILLMHLRGGRCGDTQVISPESVAFMQVDRGTPVGGPAYGMGWWLGEEDSQVVYDPGAFGAISWLDMERGIGGYVGIDDYDLFGGDSGQVYSFVLETILPLQQAEVDRARAEAGL